VLQITKENIRLKLGVKKRHRPLITTERAWASPRGQNGHSPQLLEIGTKSQNF